MGDRGLAVPRIEGRHLEQDIGGDAGHEIEDGEGAWPSVEAVERAAGADQPQAVAEVEPAGRDGEAVARGGDAGDADAKAVRPEDVAVAAAEELGEAAPHVAEADEGEANPLQDGRVERESGTARGPIDKVTSRSLRSRLWMVSRPRTWSTASWMCRSTGRIEQSELFRQSCSRPE